MGDSRIRAGILGATGAVGQNYLLLLENHPWFRVSYLAASPRSAGKRYDSAVKGKWFMDREIPSGLGDFILGDAGKVEDAFNKCDFVFSCYEGSKEEIQKTEMNYASSGMAVVSNNSAHRWTSDVLMLIPEINSSNLPLINVQRKNRGFERGFVVTKPNCSIQSYLLPLYALIKKGYEPSRVVVSTQQALSGAGYPGVPSLDIVDNVIPYIGGEEEKTEREPLRILGDLGEGGISYPDIKISATCTRVPVVDGHSAIVNMEFRDRKPNSLDEIIDIWNGFGSFSPEILPSAPERPIIYRYEDDRPQPRRDRDSGKGMSVSVGRLRKCSVFDIKFVGLSHNTVLGAAGGAILSAELLLSKGYLR